MEVVCRGFIQRMFTVCVLMLLIDGDNMPKQVAPRVMFFRVYKYVLVGKHGDEDDKSFILKSNLKLIVLEYWPFLSPVLMFSIRLFLVTHFSMPRLKEKLDFAICYDLRNMRLHPFLETQVILKGCFIF